MNWNTTSKDLGSLKKEVATLYNRTASQYGQSGPDIFSRLGRRLVELVGVSENAHILDVGAGRGAILFPAAEKVGPHGHVVGIDLAELMVEKTTAEIRRRGVHNATMQQMDAENMSFDNDSFDYVLCGLALFLFPQLTHTLSEFYRVLRHQGKLGLTVARNSDAVSKAFSELLVAYRDKHRFPLSPMGDALLDYTQLPTILTEAGFTNIQVVEEINDFVYTDDQEWWSTRWTHGSRYALENMPAKLLDAFKADMFAKIKKLKQPNGIHEQWHVWYARGTK